MDIICDVCSQLLSRSDIIVHIQLHSSQISRLSKSLAKPNLDSIAAVHQREPTSIDTESHVDSVEQFDQLDLGDQSTKARQKAWHCPSCDHAAFNRKQELVRHFARHYNVEKVCEHCSSTFFLASKYIWHRCNSHFKDRQKAYRERWQSLRKTVEIALHQACKTRLAGKRQQQWRAEQMHHRTPRSYNATCNTLPYIVPEGRANTSAEVFSSHPDTQPADQVPNPQDDDHGSRLLIAENSSASHNLAACPSNWFAVPPDAPGIWDSWNWQSLGTTDF